MERLTLQSGCRKHSFLLWSGIGNHLTGSRLSKTVVLDAGYARHLTTSCSEADNLLYAFGFFFCMLVANRLRDRSSNFSIQHLQYVNKSAGIKARRKCFRFPCARDAHALVDTIDAVHSR